LGSFAKFHKRKTEKKKRKELEKKKRAAGKPFGLQPEEAHDPSTQKPEAISFPPSFR
jgi:hypothetical protein